MRKSLTACLATALCLATIFASQAEELKKAARFGPGIDGAEAVKPSESLTIKPRVVKGIEGTDVCGGCDRVTAESCEPGSKAAHCLNGGQARNTEELK